MILTRFVPGGALALALVLASAAILTSATAARAALEKPAYAAGDRWVYILQGSLGRLPGFNASQAATFHLGLNGLVEVDVVGPTHAVVGGASVPAMQIESRASGYLNGTFAISGNATIGVSGTFSSDTSEVWEDRAYLPVSSNSSSSYVIDVTLVIKAQVRADLWLNATTAYASIPAFNLSIGGSGAAPFTTDVTATSRVSFFGQTQTMQNHTTLASTWSRQVLSQENVTVEAGTFAAYRLNESLGGIPGLAAVPASGANETAWFSNDVGYYVMRAAYVNGSPVAEMRLKSYTYPVQPPGPSILEIALLLAVPIAVVAVLAILLLRRRKARPEKAKASSGVGPVGELPPKNPGGNP